MTNVLHSLFGRFLRGKPIVVVSGLPRSGTSMMMRMLESGGMEVVSDNVRQHDEDNPRGYFEIERVKDLDKGGDKLWLSEARGKAIKVISFLLKDLPPDFDYKIIFMQRHLDEVLASQEKMLERRNEKNQTDDEEMKASYAKHLKDAEFFLRYRKNFHSISIQYEQAVQNPLDHAKQVNDFLGGTLDVSAMAAAVEAGLHRNRKAPSQEKAVKISAETRESGQE